MSNEELLEAFGEIRSDFIMDARQAVQKKCVHSVRKIAVLTAAAAMLIALAGTAVAYFSEADWFMTYFSQRTEEPLTTQQNQYIEDQTVSIGQSATSGGVTVTLESAFSDGYSGFVKLQVAAPEEITLEGLSGIHFDAALKCEAPEGTIGVDRISWTPREDGDGKGNTMTLLLKVEVAGGLQSEKRLTTAYPWVFTMENLGAYHKEYPYDAYILAECAFTFQFLFTQTEQELSELTPAFTAFACPAMRMMGQTEEVQIETFTLRSMGAELTYTFYEGDLPEAVELAVLTVYMKDGTSAPLYPASGRVMNHLEPERALGIAEFSAEAPIVLADAAYVQFPNGEKIMLTP